MFDSWKISRDTWSETLTSIDNTVATLRSSDRVLLSNFPQTGRTRMSIRNRIRIRVDLNDLMVDTAIRNLL